jgi:hypothetical protein
MGKLQGSPRSAAALGDAVGANSSNTPLGSAGEFEGAWTVDYLQHIGVNVLADQDGTLYVEYAIVKDGVDPAGTLTDDDVVETFSGAEPIYADTAYFRTLASFRGAGTVAPAVGDIVLRVVKTAGTTLSPSCQLFYHGERTP